MLLVVLLTLLVVLLVGVPAWPWGRYGRWPTVVAVWLLVVELGVLLCWG